MPNPSIDQLKKFLSDGYQITSKDIKISKLEGKEEFSLEVEIKLAKGNESKTISMKDDPEFFWFTEHFIKKKDRFDNYVFEFSESDLPTQKSDKTPQTFVDKHIVEIGSRPFDEGVWLWSFVPRMGNKPPLVEFFLRSEKNQNLSDIDFKDWVKIIEKSSGKAIFGGYIAESHFVHDDLFFSCIGLEKYLQYSRITLEFLELSVHDSLYFMSKLSGLETNIAPELLQKMHLQERDFVIIMPLKNLVLQENIAIGNCEIYHKLDNIEDHLIRKANTGINDSDWNGNHLRIRTIVRANDYHSAIVKGFERISRIIDWFGFRSDFSFPSYESATLHPVPFSAYRHFSRITVPPKIFCRDKESSGHVFLDLRSIVENRLVLDTFAENYFKSTQDLFQELLTKDTDSHSNIERAIIEACHWLRLSLFSVDTTERLLFLNMAIEFATANLQSNTLFPNDKIVELKKGLDPITLNAKQKEVLESRLNALNDAPLFERIKHFCESNTISITEDEWKLIHSARKKRNDIIHGRTRIKVNVDELEKFQTLIERMILKRLKN